MAYPKNEDTFAFIDPVRTDASTNVKIKKSKFILTLQSVTLKILNDSSCQKAFCSVSAMFRIAVTFHVP